MRSNRSILQSKKRDRNVQALEKGLTVQRGRHIPARIPDPSAISEVKSKRQCIRNVWASVCCSVFFFVCMYLNFLYFADPCESRVQILFVWTHLIYLSLDWTQSLVVTCNSCFFTGPCSRLSKSPIWILNYISVHLTLGLHAWTFFCLDHINRYPAHWTEQFMRHANCCLKSSRWRAVFQPTIHEQ